MKKEINRVLGNSLRCILPSFWWKRLLGKMADRIESAESAATSATQTVVRIANDVYDELDYKQDKLYSGSNIKTINGQSIIGSGNLEVGGGEVDSALSETSTNPVQNKVIYETLAGMEQEFFGMYEQQNKFIQDSFEDVGTQLLNKADISYVDEKVANAGGSGASIVVDSELSTTSTNPVQNKAITIPLNLAIERIDDLASEKQDEITDLDTIRDGAAKGATALQSVPSEYVTESELTAKGYATTTQLTAKQDTISDLATIRNGAALGATALQSVPSEYITETELNNKGYITNIPDVYVTDEELDVILNEVTSNEEVISASLNEMNARINEVSEKVTGDTATKDELQQAVNIINQTINDNEEVTASALNIANTRIDALEKNVSGVSVTKSEFESAISEVYSAIVENEEVHAHALNDINNKLQTKIVAIDLGIIIED